MTRAEYKQALRRWRSCVGCALDAKPALARMLAEEIINYEWAHGLRYLVWAVKWHWGDGIIGPDMLRAAGRKHARLHARHLRASGCLRVRITRAVRKPAGSP